MVTDTSRRVRQLHYRSNRNLAYLYTSIHVMNQIETHTLTRWNLIGLGITAPGTCVIAQQYSSTTFFSLPFHSCTEKFGALTKKYYFILSSL